MKKPFGFQAGRGTGGYVVVYHGTDPFHHRGHPGDPRRPSCRPDSEPGVLQQRKRAASAGLIACHACWSNDASGIQPQQPQQEHR